MASQLDVEAIEIKLREIFQSRCPDEKLETFIGDAGRAKLTVLTKAMTIATSGYGDESSPYESDECDKRAASILKIVFRLIVRSFQINSEEVTDITCCAMNGAANFSTASLAYIIRDCLEYLRSHEESDVPMLWIEVFGRVVAILSSRKDIDFDNDILSGKELRASLVNHICRMNWGGNNASYLIAAFREFPDLDNVEIDIIIHKAVDSMKVMDPPAVPPVAYQLLLLTGDKRPGVLLQSFDEYFRGVIFQEPGPLSSQATGANTQLKRKALGTVVFHFIQAARHCSSLVKEVVRRIKNSRVDHKLVMTPFMLSISMGLTCIEHFKPQIVDGLKRSIITNLGDVHNGDTNAWYRKACGDMSESFMDCFRAVIDTKSSELDFMLDGLKDLALKLLSVAEPETENLHAIERCRSLGSYIICAIVKKHNEFFASVIDDLLKNKKSIVHINCLATCLKSMIRVIVQSSMSGRISELINHLPLMTVDTATPIIKAMIPSFQLSRKLLSELIVVLRKTVYKSTEARKISAQAMILLLSNSRIIGAIPRSQYSESQNIYSQATQTQVEILGTARENESLCFEVLWILKRFFTQPSEVREQLYLGLHVVSRKNPELIKVICSHLLTQVHQYMNTENNEIKMCGLLDCSDPENTIWNEHLGYLIQCLSCVTTRGRRIYRTNSDEQPQSLIECEIILAKWVEIMSNIQPGDLELAASEAAGGSVRSLESVKEVRNALIIQIMQALEALIEYVALRSASQDAQRIEDLFKKYMELVPLLKPMKPKVTGKDGKKGKSGGKKVKLSKKSSNSSINQSATAGDSQLDKQKGKQESSKPLVLVHIINLESILEIVKHLNGSTSDKLTLGSLESKFEGFILEILKQKMERIKKKENLGERERKPEDVVTNIASVAGALWELCRKRMISTTEDDSVNSGEDIQVLEANKTPLSGLRFQILLDLVEFLVQQTSVPFLEILRLFNFEVFDDKTFDDMFEDFFEAWSSLVMKCTAEGRDPKELEFLFAILDTFGKFLPSEASASSKKALEWCMNYAKTAKPDFVPTIELCGVVMKAILTVGSKLEGAPEQEFLKLAKLAHRALGDVDDELQKFVHTNEEEHWLINTETAAVVICSIGLYVRDNLTLITGIIQRLRIQSQYYGVEKSEALRDSVCTILTFLINLSTELIRSCFPSGPCVDILQSVMDQVFITTTLLTEHFIEIHSKLKVEVTAMKFVNLVKLIGKDFKIRVETLITHIECIQRDKAEALIKSKKGGRVPAALKQKFMKDARTIPALIYHVEKYEQMLYALEQKTKVNLLAGTKLSTARDFRIELKELKEALAENHTEKQPKKKNNREASVADSTTNYSTVQQSGLSRLSQMDEESNSSSTATSRKSQKRKRRNENDN